MQNNLYKPTIHPNIQVFLMYSIKTHEAIPALGSSVHKLVVSLELWEF